jgi:ATP/maltotriose-dependent transcriptional regulator MalT
VQSFLGYYLDGDWPAIAEGRARPLTDADMARVPIQLPAAAWAARAYVQAGRSAEAERLLAALTPVLEQMHPRMWVHNGAVVLAATAVWELGAVAYAARYLRLARDLPAAGVCDFPIGSVDLTIARMAALRGDMADAHDWFNRARTRLEADGRRPERAIVDHDEALALLRAGSSDRPRIAALLDGALAQFRVLGMDGWAARAAGRLRELEGARRYPDSLTRREVEVLRLLAAGRSNHEIAAALVLSSHTVGRHIANIYAKINVHGRAEATAYALRHGLLDRGLP